MLQIEHRCLHFALHVIEYETEDKKSRRISLTYNKEARKCGNVGLASFASYNQEMIHSMYSFNLIKSTFHT